MLFGAVGRLKERRRRRSWRQRGKVRDRDRRFGEIHHWFLRVFVNKNDEVSG
jgi:hypothetical protein